MLGLAVSAAALPHAGLAFAQALKIDNAAAMTGITQVVIGGFVVAFLTDRVDRARAGGGLLGGGFGGRSTARSALEGVSDLEFQRATDAAYQDFLGQMAAAGYQLGDRAAVVEAFARNNASPLENAMERDIVMGRDTRAKARLFAPTEIGDVWLGREAGGQMGLGGFSGARSAIGVSMGGAAHARASGQAVINAFYVIDFARAETYGGWFRSSSAVSVGAGLAVVPETSKLFAFAPNGRVVSATLREPVAVGGDYGTFDETSTGAQRAAQIATNVIGVLGGIGTNSTKRYTMMADPERWTAGVGELATAANARMIQGLQTGR